MSADLLELEVEHVDTGYVFIDFQNLIDRFKTVSSEDWQTLVRQEHQKEIKY